MSKKSKGINAEREIVHLFWKNNWGCIRVAGSGSTQLPSVDVIAGNKKRKIAMECKVINDKKKYFSDAEIEQLKLFSDVFGAEPWIGVKFNRIGWYFFMIEDLKKTKSGYVIDSELAKYKGLLFEELTADK